MVRGELVLRKRICEAQVGRPLKLALTSKVRLEQNATSVQRILSIIAPHYQTIRNRKFTSYT
jgi:hypothetical protein